MLVPYGNLDDGPRFVFTFAPAAAAAVPKAEETRSAANCPEPAPPPPPDDPPRGEPAPVPATNPAVPAVRRAD